MKRFCKTKSSALFQASREPSGYSDIRGRCICFTLSLPMAVLLLSFVTHSPLRFPLVLNILSAFPSQGHPGSALVVSFLAIPGPCIFHRDILGFCW